MSKRKFQAVIQHNGTGGMYIIVPFDVEKEYGKKRVKILAKIETEYYRGSLVRMGSPDHILLIKKDIRNIIGKTEGDMVNIELEEDTKPRVVKVPNDFQALLDDNKIAKTFYQNLAYSHQRQYIEWIEAAKREDTRIRRMHKALKLMEEGKKEK